MSSAPIHLERRAAQRFSFQLPVTIHLPGEKEARGVTQDVSARGALVFTDMKVMESSGLELTLVLPPEITLTESMRVRGRGKALRVEGPGPGGKFAVAIVVDHYEYLPALDNQPRPMARAISQDEPASDSGSGSAPRGYHRA
ncbi:MAG TPA: PilZ domain-containing protein [Terriglobales bacterium]|nr:PilZ domain-containing protein [Terriglobales bacterium]